MTLNGFLNVNKSLGSTSHDAVAEVRHWLKHTHGKVKVGHAGTLDPLASGVLIICIGQATRLSDYVMHSRKRYRATIHLGVITTTYDTEGEITQSQDASHITLDHIQAALPNFIGTLEQVPPIYSAIKKDGRKLYDLARAGATIELEARTITIYQIELITYAPPFIVCDIECAAGTYIRSFAYDLGQALGVGAHLAALIRLQSGRFHVEDAHYLEQLASQPNWEQHLIPPRTALADWQSVELTPEQIHELQFGRGISLDATFHADEVMAYRSDGHLLAILQNRTTYWQPHKVFLD